MDAWEENIERGSIPNIYTLSTCTMRCITLYVNQNFWQQTETLDIIHTRLSHKESVVPYPHLDPSSLDLSEEEPL